MGIGKTGTDSMTSIAGTIRRCMRRGYATQYSQHAWLSLAEALRRLALRM